MFLVANEIVERMKCMILFFQIRYAHTVEKEVFHLNEKGAFVYMFDITV